MSSARKPAAGAWSLPETERDRARATRGTFLFHLRPIRLPARALPWTHTLGLGGSSFVLTVCLAFTGILMLLVYQPVPDVAYDSVLTLVDRVRFGDLVRGVHYWSANLLVVVLLVHAARVFLTGGYQRPRRLNWAVGAVLLGIVAASAFTGYLLPWDQRAYWAITISTGMLPYIPGIGELLQRVVRGGPEIGQDTLLIFYTFHTTILPVCLFVLAGFHFWRVRKAGGVVVPEEPAADAAEPEARPPSVMFMPHLLVREFSQALVVLAVVVVLGAFVGAPIGPRANPGMSPNPAKAPWYFMGLQELLIHLHPTFAVFVVPLAAALAFLALPFAAREGESVGRWFLSANGRRFALRAAVAGFVLTVAGVLIDEAIGAGTGGAWAWLLRGVVPLALLGAILLALWRVARRGGASHNEALQALVVFLAVAFVTLTLIGVFFRGPGMALSFPWGG